MPGYQDKRVLITGGASGIGLATARLLLACGAKVMVTGRSDVALASARRELGEHLLIAESDAAAVSATGALAKRIATEFGGLDALIICAGQTKFASFETTTEADYDRLLEVNAKGPYFLIQKLSPLMAEGAGVVVVTSVADAKGLPMISAYAASKAALRSMVRSLARELLPRGIRVNAVSPGPIDSGVLEKTQPDTAEETRRQMTESNPMKRFGRPEEVARARIPRVPGYLHYRRRACGRWRLVAVVTAVRSNRIGAIR